MFDANCNSIELIDPTGNQVVLNCAHLEPDINKYNDLLINLSFENLEVPDISSLCDASVKKIELRYFDSVGKKHSLIVKRDTLLSIPQNLFRIIKDSFNLDFTFPDSDNLFNINQKNFKSY